MSLSIIVAMDENGLIGRDNDLPWRLPNDLKRVKEITSGHTIVMGRKNYESIGHPLPDRRNIIITRNTEYTVDGCEIIYNPDPILNEVDSEEEVYIFGGSEIYKIFLPFVKTIYITRINHSFEGDTYFPEINWDEWHESCREVHGIDEKNKYPHTFYIYDRKNHI
jgi:dihydrofolate reductase